VVLPTEEFGNDLKSGKENNMNKIQVTWLEHDTDQTGKCGSFLVEFEGTKEEAVEEVKKEMKSRNITNFRLKDVS